MRYIYHGTYQAGSGAAIPNGTVKVYLAGTDTLANIYTLSAGGSAVDQTNSPLTSDTNGHFYFYVDDTDYPSSQLFKTVLSATNFIPDTRDDLFIIQELISGYDYVVDASEADQGIAGGGDTLNAHIDAIGSNVRTIYFPAGAYTLTTSVTVPSNITLKFDAGAVIDGAGTLTINGGMVEAGNQQIFGSSITLSGTWVNKELMAEWKGFSESASATTNTAALSSLLSVAVNSNSSVKMPQGDFSYSGELTITDTVRLRGSGVRQTILRADSSYAGWFLTVDDCWRDSSASGGEGAGTDDLDFGVIKSGVVLSDFSIVGSRSAGVAQHGIRTDDRVDQLYMKNIDLLYLKGTGLSLGENGTLGLVRESTFENVIVRACGDATYAPFIISGGSASGDGTNHLDFINFRLVYNYSAAEIYSDITADKKIRRLKFSNFMLHGRHTEADAPADDLLKITGRVENVQMFAFSTNGSHDVAATKYATIRFLSDGTYYPIYITIDGDTRTCNGNGYHIEAANFVNIYGTAELGSITGDELTVDASSIPSGGYVNYDVQGANADHSIVVDSTVANYVNASYQKSGALPIRLESGKLVFGDNSGGANTPTIYFGSDTDPNSVVTAPRRSIYFETDSDYNVGGYGVWIKASGVGNTGWRQITFYISDTATNFNDSASNINTQGKYLGLQAWSSTANRPVYAQGTGPTATWDYADGTTAYTPVP